MIALSLGAETTVEQLRYLKSHYESVGDTEFWDITMEQVMSEDHVVITAEIDPEDAAALFPESECLQA